MDASQLEIIIADISDENECLECRLRPFDNKFELEIVMYDQFLREIIYEKWIIYEDFSKKIVYFSIG